MKTPSDFRLEIVPVLIIQTFSNYSSTISQKNEKMSEKKPKVSLLILVVDLGDFHLLKLTTLKLFEDLRDN